MAWIRIGRFDDFKGSNTLLIESDEEGLQPLIDVIRGVEFSGEPASLGRSSSVIAHDKIGVVLERSLKDIGLVSIAARDLVWRRSSEGWSDVIEKLKAMQQSGPCYQYLSGPSDDLQVMVAAGEYGEAWWNSDAG